VPRRSTREKRSATANDCILYLQEHEFDIGLEDDPTSLNEAILSVHSSKWSNAMKDEFKFMKDNDVWDLIELPKENKPIGRKWVFKTKRNLKDNVKRYKARLIAKGFTQKGGIDYKKIFSLVFMKDYYSTSGWLRPEITLNGC